MRRLALALLVAALASPAGAALEGKYYQQARDNAPNVVVIEVLKVTPPPRPTGECIVQGKVIEVERGTRYAPGDLLSLAVMCRKRGAEVKAGPVVWQERDELKRSKTGRAFLGPDGGITLYQYDVLDLR